MKPLRCCIVVLHAAGVLSANLEVASFGRREGAPQQLVDIAADDVHNFDPLALPESSARTAGRIAATSAHKPMDAFDSNGIEPIGWKRVISFRQSKRVPPNPGNRQEILKWSKSYYQMRFLKKVLRVMADAGIPSILSGGTLLGHYREGAVIVPDNDADFTVLRAWLQPRGVRNASAERDFAAHFEAAGLYFNTAAYQGPGIAGWQMMARERKSERCPQGGCYVDFDVADEWHRHAGGQWSSPGCGKHDGGGGVGAPCGWAHFISAGSGSLYVCPSHPLTFKLSSWMGEPVWLMWPQSSFLLAHYSTTSCQAHGFSERSAQCDALLEAEVAIPRSTGYLACIQRVRYVPKPVSKKALEALPNELRTALAATAAANAAAPVAAATAREAVHDGPGTTNKAPQSVPYVVTPGLTPSAAQVMRAQRRAVHRFRDQLAKEREREVLRIESVFALTLMLAAARSASELAAVTPKLRLTGDIKRFFDQVRAVHILCSQNDPSASGKGGSGQVGRGVCTDANPKCRAVVRGELLRNATEFGHGGLWRHQAYWDWWFSASKRFENDEKEAAKTGLTLLQWAAQCDWNIVAADGNRSFTVPQNVTSVENDGTTRVSCGGHDAPSCAACPAAKGAKGKGAGWCHGDCVWRESRQACTPHGEVNCGAHRAKSCAECPMGNGAGWCNGECVWNNDACEHP